MCMKTFLNVFFCICKAFGNCKTAYTNAYCWLHCSRITASVILLADAHYLWPKISAIYVLNFKKSLELRDICKEFLSSFV